MAPELHRGEAATEATDVYALGCVLWTTLTGRAPYAAATDHDIARGHLERPIPQLSGNSPAIAATNHILRTTMAKDPRDRYPSAGALAAALAEACARTSATRPRRTTWPWPAVVAAAMAIVAGLLVWRATDAPDETTRALDSAAVSTQVERWARGLGFTRVESSCGPAQGEAATHCTLTVDGRRAWARADHDGRGHLAFTPEVPPRVVQREVAAFLDRRGIAGTPRCTDHLPGVVGEAISCRCVAPATTGSRSPSPRSATCWCTSTCAPDQFSSRSARCAAAGSLDRRAPARPAQYSST